MYVIYLGVWGRIDCWTESASFLIKELKDVEKSKAPSMIVKSTCISTKPVPGHREGEQEVTISKSTTCYSLSSNG